MTPVLSREEEETQEPEITLSNASLLGLFLGLVLICGVFFGFGYSVGRRVTANLESSTAGTAGNNGADAADAESQPPKASATDAPEGGSNSSSLTDREASSGGASIGGGGAATAAPKPATDSGGSVTLPMTETSTSSQRAFERSPAPALRVAAATPQMTEASDSRTEGAQAMVQVAAVVHEEDADVLVAALRKRGYSAVVRSGEPQDKLLHIQVGPFATRAEARAMKQKLASDGYNAIIKQ